MQHSQSPKDPTETTAPIAGRSDIVVALLLGLAIIGGLVAQRWALDPDTHESGWMLYAAVASLAVLSGARIAPQSILSAPASALAGAPRVRLVWVVMVIVACAATTWMTATFHYPLLAVTTWLVGLLAATLAVRDWTITPPLGTRQAWSRREILSLAVILVVAALARFAWIDSLPPYYFNDEPRVGAYLLKGMRGRDPVNLFNMGWNTWASIGLWVQGIFIPFFGLHLTTLRLSSALMGTLAVATTYLLTRELLGQRAALLAGILFALGRTGIDFSRLAVLHAQVMLIATFSFWCWWRAVNSGSARHYLWAGIGLGLGLYSYNAAQLLPVVWLGWIGLAAITAPSRIRAYWRGAALTIAGFVACTFVWWFYVTDHFSFGQRWFEWTYLARNRQVVGNIFAMWSKDGFAVAFDALWQQVSLTWLGFSVVPDASYGIGYRGGGLLDRIAAPLFILGLGLAAVSLRDRRFFLFYWWLPTTILGGVLTERPPTSWRLVGIVPLLAIIAALPLEALLEATRRHKLGHRLTMALVGALLVAVAQDNWQSYFVDFGTSDGMVDTASFLSRDIAAQPKDTRVFLLGSDNEIHLRSEMFEVNYTQREVKDVPNAADYLPLRAPSTAPLMIVLNLPVVSLAPQFQALYPEAIVHDHIRRSNGALLYRTVHLNPEQLLAPMGLTPVLADGGDAADAPRDPFAALPDHLRGKRLRWNGQVYWPTDSRLSVGLQSAAAVTVQIAGSDPLHALGSQPASAEIELPRGWQTITIEEDYADSAARPSLTLSDEGAVRTVTLWDLRRDGAGRGLQARYERGPAVLLRTIEPQLNLSTYEAVFPRETLRATLPFVATWNGQLVINATTPLEFEVRSTAPFSLRIDDSELCNLDTLKGARVSACQISRLLEAGAHEITAWWDGSNTESVSHPVLQLLWRASGAKDFELVPAERFASRL